MNIKKSSQMIASILTVKRTEYLSPHYLRVTLTGDDVKEYKDLTVGVNNKIFLPAEDGEIYFDPGKSIRRTYTHRGIDLDKNEMIIDFVAHGDSGPASAWVIKALPGDKLGVAMKDANLKLYPQADWYLLVADATGIPVVASILESLPPTAKGIAFIEVLNKKEEIPLETAADIQINWIHHDTPGSDSPLAAAVRTEALPDKSSTNVFGYVAAEFTTVKEVRSYLRNERGWEKEELHAYAYWKHGKSEDGSVQERRDEKQSL